MDARTHGGTHSRTDKPETGYICQKSYNFVDAFICYKQKCKVVSFNFAHPVDVAILPLHRRLMAALLGIISRGKYSILWQFKTKGGAGGPEM